MRKNKTWEITLTDNSRLVANEPIENAVVYTTDTEAYLNFRVIDSGFEFDSATIAMLNKDDGSIVERPMTKEDDTAVYEIESDIIPHFGLWQAQVLFKQGEEIFTSTPVTFVIERYMMAEQPPRLEDVVNWKRLYDNATETINELTRINDELTTTNETVQQAEAQRVIAEQERNEKYGSYAQQFNDVITDLSEEKDYHSLPEISAARGGRNTLGQRLDETTAQLAHTAGTLAGIDRTFGDRTFSTVAELQTTFPTGDAKRYVVASDGKWYWWNGTAWKVGQVAQAIGIADKSILPSKTNFFAESNWFNPETVNLGAFLSAGSVYTNASYFHSDYIPVKPGETILISGNIPSTGECYDAARTFVSNIGREVDADPNYTEFTIPEGVSYVRVNGFIGVFEDFIATPVETFMVVKGTVFPSEYAEYNNGFPYIKDEFLKLDSLGNTPPINPLAGKILVNDGDSITQGSNPSGGFFKNYGELVADRYDMTFHNLGIGGSTLSNVAGNNPFTGRWANLPDTLDYLTLWFGWNDQAYSTIGSIDDTVDTTFYGAWNTVLPKLIKKYPKAKIGLIVPYLPSGKEAWQQAVRDIGAKWGIPVLDLTDKDTPLIWLRDGVDPVIGQLRRSTFTYDGTHLNQDGYKYMSTFYEHFLLSL